MIKLLIVDSVRPMRDLMGVVLRDEPDIAVVGCATSREEALAKLDCCNLVLVSASLTEDAGCNIISHIMAVHPDMKVLVIDVRDAQTGRLAYLAAGAAGFVLEDESIEQLLRKMRSVIAAV